MYHIFSNATAYVSFYIFKSKLNTFVYVQIQRQQQRIREYYENLRVIKPKYIMKKVCNTVMNLN